MQSVKRSSPASQRCVQSVTTAMERASRADCPEAEYELLPTDAALVLLDVELEILQLQERELLLHGDIHVAGAEAAHLRETGHRLRFGCCRGT